MFDMDSKTLTKGCKKYTGIIRVNKININRSQELNTIQLSDFIDRFCYNLSIDAVNTEIVKNVATMCKQFNLVYVNTPPAMATGCIYYVSQAKKLNISKKDISEKCNISEVTINKCYKKLSSNEELNENFKANMF